MPVTITVPRLGWSMDEGTFVGWLKKDGEAVKAGEPLFTLEGDKAAQEVEATDSGILWIPQDAPEAGSPVAVGALLGYLFKENESGLSAENTLQGEAVPRTMNRPRDVAQASSPASSRRVPPQGSARSETPPEPAAEDGCATKSRGAKREFVRGKAGAGNAGCPIEFAAPVSRLTISPRARRRAAELGVDYRQLKGSGRSGRIIEADILTAVQSASASSASTMRRMIAQRTAKSFARAPHFYLRAEVEVTALLALRERVLPEIERATGARLTLTDLLLRAQALALRDCPHANAIWHEDGLVRFSACDVGLVVGLDEGLRVPIVRAADRGGLVDLVRQRVALVAGARAGTLPIEAMQGGATSLSNLGGGTVDEFAAVISPPQSTMLAVGRAAPRPFVVEGQLVVRTTLKLCLSVDHRVMDGGPAAEFLGRVVERIDHPEELARA